MASIIPTKDGDILKTGSSTMIDESLEKNPLTDLPAGASVVSDISPTPPKKEITYLKGWRLHMLTIASVSQSSSRETRPLLIVPLI